MLLCYRPVPVLHKKTNPLQIIPTYRKPRLVARKRSLVVKPVASFLSDIQLYDMSGMDIFVSSAMRNMITLHMPCMVMYRVLQFTWCQTAALVLMVSVLKTLIQLAMI